MDFAEALEVFLEKHCTGRQYDSCIDSPCPSSSFSGCLHPLHPKNKGKGRNVPRLCKDCGETHPDITFNLFTEDSHESRISA